MTSQVIAGAIKALNSSVRSGSGHVAMAGPSTARMSVITAKAPGRPAGAGRCDVDQARVEARRTIRQPAS
jgi:hypothetical protein